MILGIGNDIIDIRRIEKALARFGARFENRVFTPAEQAKAKRRAGAGAHIVAATYAKRFAAKEACAKALGTGMHFGVAWRNIEITNLPSGQPSITLSGGALKRLEALTPPGKTAHIHLTMTDDAPQAQAIVVIEVV